MATIEDLEQRLAELERWREGEQKRMLQAILDTQADHTATLRQHTNALANLEREVGSLRLEMRTGFGTIGTLIQTLIDKE